MKECGKIREANMGNYKKGTFGKNCKNCEFCKQLRKHWQIWGNGKTETCLGNIGKYRKFEKYGNMRGT